MERLNHHHLFLFWTLARQGSFTRAAETLRIAQSAVTAQVKSLEEALGVPLLDRTNRRRPRLTEEGAKVLEFADSIFEASAELMKWARHGEPQKAQTLRVGSLSGLSRNLQYEFLRPTLADASVRLEITTGEQDKLVRLLREHALDVILSSHNVRGEGSVNFHSHVLTRSPVIFVQAAGTGASQRGGDLAAALSRRPLYIPGQSFEARPELDAFLGSLGSNIRVAGEIDDIALLRIFALRSGAAVAIPKMGVQNDLKEETLVELGAARGIEQRFYAITRQKRMPNQLVGTLIERIRPAPRGR